MAGPLSGFTVIEIAGIGPGPFCAMMLADQGATVVRVDRKSAVGGGSRFDVLNRGRRSIALDLKSRDAVEVVLRLVDRADAIIEGFRPGVMERLGLGPDVCLRRNPKLVYGRMTGWGQSGPLAHAAGHDINYISLSGVLHSIGETSRKPVPPLNLVGDFGGGGMMLAFGVVCALLETQSSGRGQVIDAAMTDGSAILAAAIFGLKGMGAWTNNRGANLLDGGAHFYGSFECSDGRWISVGSIEPQFYALLLEKTGLTGTEWEGHLSNRDRWPALRNALGAVFATKTRDEWCEIMEGSDVCFAPVLDWDEALAHPHNRERRTFLEVDGVPQPAPAPRFDRTRAVDPQPPPRVGEHTEEILRELGYDDDAVTELRTTGAI